MNKQELDEALQPFYANDQIGISVYAVLKGEDADPKQLDIEADALAGLKGMFLGNIQNEIIANGDLTVMNLSDSDERGNVIYEYDLDIPDELEALQDVTQTDDIELLGLANASLSNIKALIVEIGDNDGQLVLYKTMAPINIFGRGSFFMIKHETRLEQIDEEFLRVSPGFQLFSVGGSIFVMDLKTIEKNFGFHDVVRREAEAGVDSIEEMGVLENPETLRELINDVKFARRLTRVARSSPVLQQGIANESIIQFCRDFPKLSGKIRFNEDEDKIVLDTQVSKDLFLKMLMDNYLTSELTELHYESLAKDSAEAEPEEEEADAEE